MTRFSKMVPRRGLEPPRPCERQHLKLVRLPIPPPGHGKRMSGRPARLEAASAPCQRACLGGGVLRRLVIQYVAGLAIQPLANRLEGAEADALHLPRLEQRQVR